MSIFRKKIEDVFTPRNQNVNVSMYVTRSDLEKELERACRRNSHTLIFGESGNGKSWLYKKVLKALDLQFVIANCANASRLESITQEIHNSIIGAGRAIKTEYEEEKSAKVSAFVAESELKHKGTYQVSQEEPLLEAFKEFSKQYSGKKIVVLDNLETIFNSEKLMNELADIIILLDDSRYSAHSINFLIVGVPNGIIEYFAKTKNMESVANRLVELPKVGGLNQLQVLELIKKGFLQLKIGGSHSMFDDIAKHTFAITLGIAQRVHEYCECLAYEIEDNKWVFSNDLLGKADLAWLKRGLRQSYQVVDSHLNSRETTVARRNQVIYAIGKIKTHQFDSGDIDTIVREEFPTTIPKTNMGIGTILNELSSTASPLLKRNGSSDFSILDPRYISCIRLMLSKDAQSQKVLRKGFQL